MAQKPGNGGHGLENYDPETGRYIGKEIDSGVEKYHAGAHFSVGEIRNMLISGYYGEELQKVFEEGDDDEQSRLIGYLQTKLDDYYTKQKLDNQKDFKQLTPAEFDDVAKECEQATSSSDRSAFYGLYTGTGEMSFEFNKALRFGVDNFIAMFPNKLRNVGLSKEKVEYLADCMDRLANAVEMPQDMQTFRFDGTGPIISWFGESGVLDGLPYFENQYGYLQLNQDNLNLDDLKDRLSTLIGSVVKKDGAFSSFSCYLKDDGTGSHMVRNPDKIIAIKYNIPKGKHAFVSNYRYESEGFFPRDTQFVLQDVKKEKFGGMERVVLYYGVK